jgi:flagellar basal-body rod modification protein FlgD
MAIAGTDSTTAAASAAAASAPANPGAQMGKDAFMKLLVAELKQQDPTDPVNAREMITQLSQLSSVEKLNAVEQDLSSMRTENRSAASVQSAGLVGRTVIADTTRLNLTSTTSPQGQYQLLGKASSVTVTVRDADKNVVRTLDGGAQNPGEHGFIWDGKDNGGNRVPNAKYSFEVTAQDANKLPVSVSTRLTGIVSQVAYENGEAELVVGDSRFEFGDVISIAN